MSFPLEMECDLRLEFGGHTFTLCHEVGPPEVQVLRFDIPGLLAGMALAHQLTMSRLIRQALVELPALLELLHLQLWITMAGRNIARLGHRAPAGTLADLLARLGGGK